MLRARSALATVFLCSLCLFAVGAPRCSKDLVTQVQALQKTTLKQELLNSSLYTPSITYYQNCPRVAFKCFAEEVNVLIKELEVNGQTVPHSEKVGPLLQTLACGFPDQQQLACQCELLQEKNATEFLSELLRTIEMMNTEFCNKVLSPQARRRNCFQMGPTGQTGPLRCKNKPKCF
uniref:Interleukin n=1 Tax=Nothobranchius korthausae TaxID=1143690 RepID=A0A1A8EKJ1_9TELE